MHHFLQILCASTSISCVLFVFDVLTVHIPFCIGNVRAHLLIDINVTLLRTFCWYIIRISKHFNKMHCILKPIGKVWFQLCNSWPNMFCINFECSSEIFWERARVRRNSMKYLCNKLFMHCKHFAIHYGHTILRRLLCTRKYIEFSLFANRHFFLFWECDSFWLRLWFHLLQCCKMLCCLSLNFFCFSAFFWSTL